MTSSPRMDVGTKQVKRIKMSIAYEKQYDSTVYSYPKRVPYVQGMCFAEFVFLCASNESKERNDAYKRCPTSIHHCSTGRVTPPPPLGTTITPTHTLSLSHAHKGRYLIKGGTTTIPRHLPDGTQ